MSPKDKIFLIEILTEWKKGMQKEKSPPVTYRNSSFILLGEVGFLHDCIMSFIEILVICAKVRTFL